MIPDGRAIRQAQRLQRRFYRGRGGFVGSQENEPVLVADQSNRPLQRWRFLRSVSI